jgi:small subunit ribosomal protein S20
MANHKSAIKEHRQSLKRRLCNRGHRARMRTAIKVLRQAIENGDAETSRSLLPSTQSIVAGTARQGSIHRNAAARMVSRLTRATNKLG